jgi:hypothetical protein
MFVHGMPGIDAHATSTQENIQRRGTRFAVVRSFAERTC